VNERRRAPTSAVLLAGATSQIRALRRSALVVRLKKRVQYAGARSTSMGRVSNAQMFLRRFLSRLRCRARLDRRLARSTKEF
jgi:hypothetical protein